MFRSTLACRLSISVLALSACTRPNDDYVAPAKADLGRAAPADLAPTLARDMTSVRVSPPDLASPVDFSIPPDLALPDVACPPPDVSPGDPSRMGDLAAQPCEYACWGFGTLYNICALGKYQFCLPSGQFAPCQPIGS